jgi:hypothetical protein
MATWGSIMDGGLLIGHVQSFDNSTKQRVGAGPLTCWTGIRFHPSLRPGISTCSVTSMLTFLAGWCARRRAVFHVPGLTPETRAAASMTVASVVCDPAAFSSFLL